jgi:caspase domain-containing protein
MRIRSGLLALAAALVALTGCAGDAQIAKGRLVPIDVPRERLEAAHAPRRIALLVGIKEFEDQRWHPLRFAEADVQDLAAVLQDRSLGAFDEVRILSSSPGHEEILRALRALAEVDRDERDTVLVYFSAHGTLARDGVGQLRRYLVAHDTRASDVPSTGIAMDEIKAAFDRLRSRRKVLVLATCHSGSGKSLLPEGLQRELAGIKGGFFVRPIEEVSRASVVLAAADWGEAAREDERLGNDIYTHFFVEALRSGADRNGDGAITVSEAHDYARRATYAYTEGRQRPSAESTEVGVDPIVLVGKVARAGKPELYSYSARLDGFTVRVNGRPLADLPGGVAVEPGRLRIQVSKGIGPEILDETLRLGPGDRIDVETLLSRSGGRWEVAPRVALLGFLDARSRREVLGVVPGWGAAVSLRGWPAPSLSLRLDATTAFGRSRLESGAGSAPFGYQAITGGVSLPWRFEPAGLHGGALLAGPRLSAVWLERRFDLALAPPRQSLFTFMPGLLVGTDLPIGGGFRAGAELHLDWMVVQVDGENRSSGFAELLGGVGYRF